MFTITVDGVKFQHMPEDHYVFRECWLASRNEFPVYVTNVDATETYRVGSHKFTSLFAAMQKSVELQSRKDKLRRDFHSAHCKPFVAD